jgi:hypothetical protein
MACLPLSRVFVPPFREGGCLAPEEGQYLARSLLE